jgi:hypothetical protein
MVARVALMQERRRVGDILVLAEMATVGLDVKWHLELVHIIRVCMVDV